MPLPGSSQGKNPQTVLQNLLTRNEGRKTIFGKKAAVGCINTRTIHD